MSSINASGGRAARYQRLAAQQTASAQRIAAPPNTRAPQQTAQAASAKPAQEAGDLSAPERQMISQQFPETPDLSMRLYGPSRTAETVRPDAVGSRLDVQG